MINLDVNKTKFEDFARDSFSTLNSSEQCSDLLKRRGNVSSNFHRYYRDIIIKNKSYDNLLSILSSDQEIQSLYGNPSYILFKFLDNMIILRSKESKDDWLGFHKTIFDQVFDILKNELYDQNWEYVSFSNLTNYQSNLPKIDFNEVKILPRTDDELKNITQWDQSSIDFFWKKLDDLGCSSEYLLVSIKTIKKDPENLNLGNSIDADNNLLNFITALRLFKEGAIGVDIIYHVRKSRFFELPGMDMGRISCEVSHGQSYILNSNEISAFSAFWNEISKFLQNDLHNFPQIRLVLNRFNFIYDSKSYLENKIIDCWIILEALFIKGRDERKKKKFLSFCISRLLFKLPNEQDNYCTKISNYYQARSDIVHSLNQSSETISSIKNVDDLITCVRKCIISFINLANCNSNILTNSFYCDLKKNLSDNMNRERIQKLARI